METALYVYTPTWEANVRSQITLWMTNKTHVQTTCLNDFYMMDEKIFFQCSVTAYLTEEQVRRLYERLWDETTHHAVRVARSFQGIMKVTIYSRYKNYFRQIINNL